MRAQRELERVMRRELDLTLRAAALLADEYTPREAQDELAVDATEWETILRRLRTAYAADRPPTRAARPQAATQAASVPTRPPAPPVPTQAAPASKLRITITPLNL